MHKVTLLLVVGLSGCQSIGFTDAGETLDAGPKDSGQTVTCLGPGAALGAPCVCQSDCGNTALCLSEFQTGYAGGICLKQTEDGGGVGLPGCDATHACRVGWVCDMFRPGGFDGGAADGGDGGTVELQGSCRPLCSANSDCPSTGHCDVNTGLCQAELSGDDFGEVCQSNAECKSRSCKIIASDLGLCRSFCNVARPACPQDAGCEPYNNAAVGETIGVCAF